MRLNWSLASACRYLILAFILDLIVPSFTVLSCHVFVLASSLSYPFFFFNVQCFWRPFRFLVTGLSHPPPLSKTVYIFIHQQHVFLLLPHNWNLSSAFSLYFSSVCLSILLSASRVAELLWSLYRHDSCSINNKTEGKRKKKSILGFIPLWFAGFTKVSVNSDHQQIQIYYQHISIVNRVFLREWTYQNLMKLFSLSPYLLLCSPQRIILAHLVCLRNSTQAPAQWRWDILNHNSVPENTMPSLCGSMESSLALTTTLPCANILSISTFTWKRGTELQTLVIVLQRTNIYIHTGYTCIFCLTELMFWIGKKNIKSKLW